MAKLRTINKAAAELKEEDPETPVCAMTIRRWITSGKLRHIKSGNRVYVDMDVLKEFMKGEATGGEE